jgi:hypothetical protein
MDWKSIFTPTQQTRKKKMSNLHTIKYRRCDDRTWAAHCTAIDPITKGGRMLVGFGRRKEAAKSDLIREIAAYVMEVHNVQEEARLKNQESTGGGEATESV